MKKKKYFQVIAGDGDDIDKGATHNKKAGIAY